MKGRFAALLLAVAVAACSKAAEAPPKPPANPADDPAAVERWLAEACAFVEGTCGRKFFRRPTVFVCSSKDAARIWREMALEDSPPTNAQERSRLEWDAKQWDPTAFWDEPRNRVVLHSDRVPPLAAGVPAVSPVDVLRLLLVHEVAHAWSDRHVNRRRGDVSGYVEEGHAHYVTERAARHWNLYPAFERYTGNIAGAAPTIHTWDEPLRHPLLASLGWTRYVVARAFVARVWAEQGRDGVEALLRSPPTRSLYLERSEDWLARRDLPREHHLASAIGPLRDLVPQSGWRHDFGDVHGDVVLRETSLLPDERRRPLRSAFEGGWGMDAVSVDSPGRFGVSVLRFRDDTAAAAYIAACSDSTPILREKFRSYRAWKCEQHDWTPSAQVSGFVCVWWSTGMWAVRTVTARTGRFVLQAGVNDPLVRDEEWLLAKVLLGMDRLAKPPGMEPARPR